MNKEENSADLNEATWERFEAIAREIANGINLPENLDTINETLVDLNSQIDLFHVTNDTIRLVQLYGIKSLMLENKVRILEQL